MKCSVYNVDLFGHYITHVPHEFLGKLRITFHIALFEEFCLSGLVFVSVLSVSETAHFLKPAQVLFTDFTGQAVPGLDVQCVSVTLE